MWKANIKGNWDRQHWEVSIIKNDNSAKNTFGRFSKEKILISCDSGSGSCEEDIWEGLVTLADYAASFRNAKEKAEKTD